ncbi:hypothetical protein C8R47DRAFT_1079083 [Mycena vitilis]|nr:hypothetical protein C8R47DRAFT_1079083 [Mycena vitilis]
MARLNRDCTYAHARPTHPRPIRLQLLTNRGPLDRWLANLDIMANPYVALHAPLADDDVRCELFIALLDVCTPSFLARPPDYVQGMYGPVYRLSLVVYDPHVGCTETLRLGRYQGIPANGDAPLWTRRLPLFKILRFTQSRAFAAMLVAGMSDIQFFEPASSQALSWARHAAIGTPVQKLVSRHCRNAALRSVKVWARGKNLRG